MFGQLLVDFLFRLTFGIAAAMALTPARHVTSGFFRVHLWVLLGLQTLAALASYGPRASTEPAMMGRNLQFWLAVMAAALSYIGAVVWMYERPRPGKVLILGVAAACLGGGWLSSHHRGGQEAWQLADFVTGGLLLGLVTTAMLLGHWYLNTPTMKLAPLKRLLLLVGAAVLVRMLVSGGGAWLEIATQEASERGMPASTWNLFLVLRWSAGLLAVLALTWLTWQTLKIPNTQSATGILYAAVILVLIGELTSQLLSAQTRYPV